MPLLTARYWVKWSCYSIFIVKRRACMRLIQVWTAVPVSDGRVWPESEGVCVAGRTAAGIRGVDAWGNQRDPMWTEPGDTCWAAHDESAWWRRCRSVLRLIRHHHRLSFRCHFREVEAAWLRCFNTVMALLATFNVAPFSTYHLPSSKIKQHSCSFLNS